MNPKLSRKVLKILQLVILFTFGLIGLATILSLLGIPKQLRIFVVETGSMSPTIPAGSLIFDIPYENYQVGDVITFPASLESTSGKSTNITHRINAIQEMDGGIQTFETKGDANQTPDVNPVNSSDVIGKVIFHIQYIGLVIGFAKTQLGFLILVIIPSIIIIYSEVLKIKSEFIRLQKRKNSSLNINDLSNE